MPVPFPAQTYAHRDGCRRDTHVVNAISRYRRPILWNLVLLCRRHHVRWHLGKLHLVDLHIPWHPYAAATGPPRE